jgi:hypothetical protein
MTGPTTESGDGATTAVPQRSHATISVAVVAATFALCVVGAAGGFVAGHRHGPSLDDARRDGAALGTREGTEQGSLKGFADGQRTGRAEGYRETFAPARKRAYESGLKKAKGSS